MSLRYALLTVLLTANVATGIALIDARHRHRQLFVELTALERERDELDIEFGRLQLEQATWADTHRIESLARDELGMKHPDPADLRVITP